MRKRYGELGFIAVGATALVALLSAPGTAHAQEKPLTESFSLRYDTKMFISTIGNRCGPLPAVMPMLYPGTVLVDPFGIDRALAYKALCSLTDSQYSEDPGPKFVAPMNARIFSTVVVAYKCEAGKTLPVEGTVIPVMIMPGLEGWFAGIVNPIQIRNDIAKNGTFSAVISGRPNLAVEPTFQVIGARQRKDIWHKISVKLTCNVDAEGKLISTNQLTLTYSKFPSHRVWLSSPSTAAPRLVLDIPQGPFTNLWSLESIAAP